MFGSVFAGSSKAKRKHVTLDVVLFSYLSRPIIDVYLNRTRLGLAGPYPFSGNGTITGVDVQLGSQELRWRLDGPKGTPGNGDRITPVNTVSLDEVPAESRYLGIHIYPDYTVELVCSKHFPELSARGKAFDLEWQKSHGS
jgi:hypothetical protein